MTCACNNLGRRDANSSLPRGTDGRTRSFRAVRAVEVQMQCRAQLCNANERPVAARLAHSSSSRLAGRANHGALLTSICSTAARRDGIGPPGTCILFNCCSTSWPTCIVILVRCQFALGVAQASPASSQEKVLVHVTWPCASSLSHSVAPLVCGRSIAAETIKCVGRQTGSVKHSGYSCFVEQHGSLNSAL